MPSTDMDESNKRMKGPIQGLMASILMFAYTIGLMLMSNLRGEATFVGLISQNISAVAYLSTCLMFGRTVDGCDVKRRQDGQKLI